MAECDRTMDEPASGDESVFVAITAGSRDAVGGGMVGATTFPTAVSVGRARGILQVSEGFVGLELACSPESRHCPGSAVTGWRYRPLTPFLPRKGQRKFFVQTRESSRRAGHRLLRQAYSAG